MTEFVVAIPARYAASRLPGKPLRLLGVNRWYCTWRAARCRPAPGRSG